MARSKLMSEEEAVRRFVDDGDVVYAGYTTIAFGLCHEIIRQRKRGLEIVGGSVGGQGSLLFLSGCADRTRTGYIGGALRPGAIQEMMDEGTLRFEDYSNQAIALMLMAGALGIPFIPTRSFLGSDYLRPEYVDHPGGFLGQQKWAVTQSPFDGQPVVLLPALRPDVAVLQAQRADEEGNVQMWGHLGDARWAFWAARKVIVSVEEIVPAETIRSDPSRTVVPGFRVSAVVHMPYGAHPSSLTGFYDADYAFQARVMAGVGQNRAAYEAFAAEWIDGAPDRAAYVRHYRDRFGAAALERIAARAGVTPRAEVRYSHAEELRFGS
jgi:glutaconate CoA-transferase subunit A